MSFSGPFSIAYWVCAIIFFIGVLASFSVGRQRALKFLISAYSIALFIGVPIVVVLTGGFALFVLPHILIGFLLLAVSIWLSTGFGGHFFKPGVSEQKSKNTSVISIGDYIPIAEFSELKSINEKKIIEMIRGGYFQGRIFDGKWYVHKSEISS